MPDPTHRGSTSAVETVPFCAPEPTEVDLNALFTAYLPKLARTARRLVRNAADSEDVLQECLLSAFKNLHQFEGRSKFSTWLHSIVRNKARMHLRRASTNRCCSLEERTSDQGELQLENAWDMTLDAEDRCLQNERSRILRQMLRDLPEGQRSVIWLCDIEGMDGKRAAARLGMTLSGLKTCLHRARRHVAKKIRGCCGTSQPFPTNDSHRELVEYKAHVAERSERKLVTRKNGLAGTTADLQVGKPMPLGVRRELKDKRKKQFYYLGASSSLGTCSLSRSV